MPNGDRTGPDGKGPQTGRAQGLCVGNETSGRESSQPRMGRRRRSKSANTGCRPRHGRRMRCGRFDDRINDTE